MRQAQHIERVRGPEQYIPSVWPRFRMRCPRCRKMVSLRKHWQRPVRAVPPCYIFRHCGLQVEYTLDQLEATA
jgi:hypothetical protein